MTSSTWTPEPELYYFDERAAERACAFFPRYLRHVDDSPGVRAGTPFELRPWQRAIVRDIFGWKRKSDGLRRFRTVYIEVPRKNGKSTWAAGLALYLLACDGVTRGRVYGAAGSADQARIIFDLARDMVEESPGLRRRIRRYANALTVPQSHSSYKPISSESKTKWGFKPSAIVYDELHAVPNRKLFDTLTTAFGSTRQPMTIILTTAGFDKHSVCREQHDYARAVANPKNPIRDDTFYGVIYAAPKDAAWDDEVVWAAANPNLGISVDPDFLRTECAKAKAMPAKQNVFRRLYLNQWTSQEERWLDMDYWDKGAAAVPTKGLRNRPCYAGLDLASNRDLSAFVLVFPPDDLGGWFDTLAWFWMPEDNVEERVNLGRVPYDQWINDGFIETTPGNVTDYRYIIKKIDAAAEYFDIQQLAYDRYGAKLVSQMLMDLGINVVPFGQGYVDMWPALRELERVILGGHLRHGNNPVQWWCADNVVVTQDPAGNLKPDKSKSEEKIDGFVALTMATGIMGMDGAGLEADGSFGL